MSQATLSDLAPTALAEIATAVGQIADEAADRLCEEILGARRIAVYGLGREALMLRALCMRLMHLGFDAHVVGDATLPPLRPGDLLIVSSGPGDLAMARTMIGIGKREGASVAVITAQPTGPDPQQANVIIHLPAQTMASDAGTTSILPMGTAFEIAMLIFFDLLAILLRERTRQTLEDLRARHTNLE